MRFNNQNQPKPGEPSPVWIKELRFTSLQDNSTIGMTNYGTNASTTIPQLEYSRDGKNWTPWFFETFLVNKGEHIYFRGNNPNGIGSPSANYSRFKGTGQFSLDGNIMSILYAEDYAERFEVTPHCFSNLFKNNSSIYDAKELLLPATTLADYCYAYMFNGCQNLVNAPELPATTLDTNCYYNMFCGCSSLVNAPEIRATTLATYCYYSMFYGCTSLVNAPELRATTLATYCYYSMFKGCTSLVNAPKLPATTLATYCYYYMFDGCSSLTNAPELPATTLANYCYSNMFNKCINLVNAPELPATTLYTSCYYEMFNSCASLVNAPELPATTLANYCYYGMFRGCSSLVNAPELRATTLSSGCYNGMFDSCTSLVNAPIINATSISGEWPLMSKMFNNCSSLTYVKHHITDWVETNSDAWLSGVAPNGTVECPAASTIPSNRVSGIPTGWTRVDL